MDFDVYALVASDVRCHPRERCVGRILENDASDGCAGYGRCVSADRPAERAGVRGRRWFPAGVAESQWLASVVLAVTAAVMLTMLAWAVMLTIVAGSGGLQCGLWQ